jgi:hypothetical protein
MHHRIRLQPNPNSLSSLALYYYKALAKTEYSFLPDIYLVV